MNQMQKLYFGKCEKIRETTLFVENSFFSRNWLAKNILHFDDNIIIFFALNMNPAKRVCVWCKTALIPVFFYCS